MADLQKISQELSELTVLEAAELVKMLEESWGVSAAAAVATAAPAAVGGEAEPAAAEQDSFTVVLKSFGDQKINVIKEVRGATGLGLKEAKELVEAAPKEIKEDLSKEDAEALKAKLEEAGAEVELR